MPRLPVIKPKEIIKAIKAKGFILDHVSGSHHIFYNADKSLRVTVPYHNKPLKRKTLVSILKQAQISPEEVRALI